MLKNWDWPEVSILGVDQKDRDLWGRKCMAVRTQLNAAHAQLSKKWLMDDFLTFSERHLFLKNHSIEFHKTWQKDTSDSG